MKYKRQFVKSYKGAPGSKQSDESMTDPSMFISMKQMLINHSKGINTKVKQYEPQYFGDEPIPEINDLVDAQDYVEDLKARQAEAKKKVEQEAGDFLQKKIDAEKKRSRSRKEGESTLEPGKETHPGGKSDPSQSP